MSLNKKDFVLVGNMWDTFVETPYLGTQKNEWIYQYRRETIQG